MLAELLKFESVGEGRFKVEIWGDSIHNYGVMHVDRHDPVFGKSEDYRRVSARCGAVASGRQRSKRLC